MRLQTTGQAKPGTKRRKRDETVLSSPEHIKDEVEMLTGDSPLYNDLENYVDPNINIDNIDIDDLVRHDMPDVLLGVIKDDTVSPASDHTPSPDHQQYMRSLSPELQPPGCPPPPPGCPAPGYLEHPTPDGPGYSPPGASYCDSVEEPKIRLDYDSIGSSVQDLTPKRNKRSLFNPNMFNAESRESTVETDSISTKSLISRINSLNRRQQRDSVTDDSIGSSSLVSDKNTDQSDDETKIKVLELKHKFEGVKDKCIEKIKTKIIKPEEEKTILDHKQTRADCFPAFVFVMTPIAVVIIAGR